MLLAQEEIEKVDKDRTNTDFDFAENLSKYRKELMGIAICLIMFCHNDISVPLVFENALSILKSFAQVGVDIFFLLSGFGCYFSFYKNPDVVQFYKKRIIRILPAYFIIHLAYGVFRVYLGQCGKMTLSEFFMNFSIVTFFTQGVLEVWFIGAVLFLYLLYPLIYKFVDCNNSPKVICCMSIWVLLSLLISVLLHGENRIEIINEIFLIRFGDFVLGSMLAKSVLENGPKMKYPSTKNIVTSGGGLFGILVLNETLNRFNPYWLMRLLFLPLSIWICMVATISLSSIKSEKQMALCYLGGITLEIYLIHEKLLYVIPWYLHFLRDFLHNEFLFSVVINFVAVILAVAFGKIIHELSELFSSTFRKK